jgi:hypothetical protein
LTFSVTQFTKKFTTKFNLIHQEVHLIHQEVHLIHQEVHLIHQEVQFRVIQRLLLILDTLQDHHLFHWCKDYPPLRNFMLIQKVWEAVLHILLIVEELLYILHLLVQQERLSTLHLLVQQERLTILHVLLVQQERLSILHILLVNQVGVRQERLSILHVLLVLVVVQQENVVVSNNRFK